MRVEGGTVEHYPINRLRNRIIQANTITVHTVSPHTGYYHMERFLIPLFFSKIFRLFIAL